MDIWLLLLAAAVGGVAGALCTRSIPNIKAKRIEIVDDKGKARILLVAGASEPHLYLLDAKGKTLIHLGVSEANPSLSIWGEGPEPKLRAAIATMPDGKTNFVVFDTEGRARVGIGASSDSGGLECWNDEGKRRLSLTASSSGSTLDLLDDNETSRATLYSGSGGIDLDLMQSTFLKVAGQDETKLGIIPPVIESLRNRSGLTLADGHGVTRAAAIVEPPVGEPYEKMGKGYFAIYDDKDGPVWRAPGDAESH